MPIGYITVFIFALNVQLSSIIDYANLEELDLDTFQRKLYANTLN